MDAPCGGPVASAEVDELLRWCIRGVLPIFGLGIVIECPVVCPTPAPFEMLCPKVEGAPSNGEDGMLGDGGTADENAPAEPLSIRGDVTARRVTIVSSREWLSSAQRDDDDDDATYCLHRH